MNKKLSQAIDLGRQDAAATARRAAEVREREEERARAATEAIIAQYVVWLEGCNLLYARVRQAVGEGRDGFLLYQDDLPDPKLDHLSHLARAIGRIDGFRAVYEHDNNPAEGGPPIHSIKVGWSYLA